MVNVEVVIFAICFIDSFDLLWIGELFLQRYVRLIHSSNSLSKEWAICFLGKEIPLALFVRVTLLVVGLPSGETQQALFLQKDELVQAYFPSQLSLPLFLLTLSAVIP